MCLCVFWVLLPEGMVLDNFETVEPWELSAFGVCTIKMVDHVNTREGEIVCPMDENQTGECEVDGLLLGLVVGLAGIGYAWKFRDREHEESEEETVPLPEESEETVPLPEESEETVPLSKEPQLTCPVCSSKVDEDWFSCPYCGANLMEDTQTY